MFDDLIEAIRAAIDNIWGVVYDMCNEFDITALTESTPYSPRARPTHRQRATEPKTKPHTLPMLRRRRVFHCRNCLPFVLIVVDEE